MALRMVTSPMFLRLLTETVLPCQVGSALDGAVRRDHDAARSPSRRRRSSPRPLATTRSGRPSVLARQDRGDVPEREVVVAGDDTGHGRGATGAGDELHVQAVVLEEALLHAEVDGGDVDDRDDADPDRRGPRPRLRHHPPSSELSPPQAAREVIIASTAMGASRRRMRRLLCRGRTARCGHDTLFASRTLVLAMNVSRAQAAAASPSTGRDACCDVMVRSRAGRYSDGVGEGVDEGVPRRLDDVVVDADGGPLPHAVRGVDEHPGGGARAALPAEDAHLVVGQRDVRRAPGSGRPAPAAARCRAR